MRVTLLSQPAGSGCWRQTTAVQNRAKEERVSQESTSPVCRRSLPLNLSELWTALFSLKMRWRGRCGVESGVPTPALPHQPGVAKKLWRVRAVATAHWGVREGTELHGDRVWAAPPSPLWPSLGTVCDPTPHRQLSGGGAHTARAHLAQDGRQTAGQPLSSHPPLPPDLTAQHRGFHGLGAPSRRVHRP